MIVCVFVSSAKFCGLGRSGHGIGLVGSCVVESSCECVGYKNLN